MIVHMLNRLNVDVVPVSVVDTGDATDKEQGEAACHLLEALKHYKLSERDHMA